MEPRTLNKAYQFDISIDELNNLFSQKFIDKIKDIKVKRGDIINSNDDYFIYDGEKIIKLNDTIPKNFKIPLEFPIDYWQETGFINFDKYLFFDTDVNQEFKPFKNMDFIDGNLFIYIRFCLETYYNHNIGFILISEKELSYKEQDIYFKKLIDNFKKDGLCNIYNECTFDDFIEESFNEIEETVDLTKTVFRKSIV